MIAWTLMFQSVQLGFILLEPRCGCGWLFISSAT